MKRTLVVINRLTKLVWTYEGIDESKVEEFIEKNSRIGTWGRPQRWVALEDASFDEKMLAIGSEEKVWGGHLYQRILIPPEFSFTLEEPKKPHNPNKE